MVNKLIELLSDYGCEVEKLGQNFLFIQKLMK